MFDKWMLILLKSLDEQQSIGTLPREDLKICATHLANRSSGRVSPCPRRVSRADSCLLPLLLTRTSLRLR